MQQRIKGVTAGLAAGIMGASNASAQTRWHDRFFGNDDDDIDIASAGTGGVATASASGGASASEM